MSSQLRVTKQPEAASRISHIPQPLTPVQKIEDMIRNALSIEQAAKQAGRPSLHYSAYEILYHGNRVKAGLAVYPERSEEAVRLTLDAVKALARLSCAHADAAHTSRFLHNNRLLEKAVDIDTKRLEVALHDLQMLAFVLDPGELN